MRPNSVSLNDLMRFYLEQTYGSLVDGRAAVVIDTSMVYVDDMAELEAIVQNRVPGFCLGFSPEERRQDEMLVVCGSEPDLHALVNDLDPEVLGTYACLWRIHEGVLQVVNENT